MNKGIIKFAVIIFIISFVYGCGQVYRANPKERNAFSFGSSAFYYNSPAIVGNYLYIGNSRRINSNPAQDNYFYKLDLNLNMVWAYSLEANEVRGGAVLDSLGNIYFPVDCGRLKGDASSAECYLYSLTNDGSLRWTKKIAGLGYVSSLGMMTPAVSSSDVVYIGGEKLYAFDKNGNVLYQNAVQYPQYNSPIIDASGNLYFVSASTVVSTTPTLEIRWTYNTGSTVGGLSSMAFSTDESKTFACVEQTLYCLNANTGALLWSYSPQGISGTIRSTPAVDDHDNVYFGTKADSNSSMYAVKNDGSTLLWKISTGADIYSSSAIGNDRTIYFGTELSGGDRLYAVDADTGATKWKAKLSSDVTWSSPALLYNGLLYIACMEQLNRDDSVAGPGYVYLFQADSAYLLSNAGSPRFHLGNSNSGRRE